MKLPKSLAAGALALAVTVIGSYEGLKTKAYIPIKGDVPTVCFGETRGVKLGDSYTITQCKEMFGKRLVEFSTNMNKCLKAPASIPDKSYVAFLSLAYNIGEPAFCASSVTAKINAGDIRGACERLPAFNKSGGRVVKGLVNRRADERKLCLEGLR
ncbi:lysozyme [Mesorhizobium loti]|nr:lysozyme [Mesorhizobium loti]PLP55542.1 lysozyme [Mesorhizobium loti]